MGGTPSAFLVPLSLGVGIGESKRRPVSELEGGSGCREERWLDPYFTVAKQEYERFMRDYKRARASFVTEAKQDCRRGVS